MNTSIVGPAGITWQWAAFPQLDGSAMHAMLAARQQVFVLEQNCLYADIDGFDPQAMHLLGWKTHSGVKNLVAYARCFAPGIKCAETAIGRVLTVSTVRRQGLGTALMAEAIARATSLFPDADIRVSAQSHLEAFYASFGFCRDSDDYLEDGIVHMEMLLKHRS